MAKSEEEEKTHNDSPVEERETEDENEVEIVNPDEKQDDGEDLEEIRRRAEVSSQNFERAKKAEQKAKELEAELESLRGESKDEPLDTNSETVASLQSELAEIRAANEKRDVLEAHPQLKEVWDSFEEFRADEKNTGMTLQAAARVFLAEKEDLAPETKRKGVERAPGGTRTPPKSGMSTDDLKNVRTGDSKKYREMLRKDQIRFRKA